MATDPNETLRKWMESAQGIRFGKGVVGKTTHVAIAVLVVWAVLAWRWSDNLYADGGLLLFGLIVTGFAIWYIRSIEKFARENPAQAMLDGAEFIEYQKWEIEVKGLPPVRGGVLVEDRGSGLAPETDKP